MSGSATGPNPSRIASCDYGRVSYDSWIVIRLLIVYINVGIFIRIRILNAIYSN